MNKLWYRIKRGYKPQSGTNFSDSPSLTVQGESRTIKEIVEAYRKTGQIQRNEPVYFDQEDMEQINKYYAPGSLDFTDLDELTLKSEYLRSAINDAKKKKEKAEKEEADKNQLKLDLYKEKEE